MTPAQLRARSTEKLYRQTGELDRIDTAVISARNTDSSYPSATVVFDVLIMASNTSADVLDAYSDEAMPVDVRNGLLHLHCSVTGLLISLRLYGDLMYASKPITPSAGAHRHCDALRLH